MMTKGFKNLEEAQKANDFLMEQIALFNEKDALHEQMVNELVKQISELKDENHKLGVIVKNLSEQLLVSRKNTFCSTSEQIKNLAGFEQLSFFNEAETESDAKAPEPTEETIIKEHTRKKKRTMEEIKKGLTHREVIIDLSDDEKKCDICNSDLECIGKEKVRSELEIIPAQICVIDYFVKVYKCQKCEDESDQANIIKAIAPTPMMKKSIASPSTVAYIMQEKYQNGVTLFRLEKYWHSRGVQLNRNTLANWIIRSSRLLEPMYELMKKLLFCEDIVHADETELRVLKIDGSPTKSMARMWVFCSGKDSDKPMSIYYYHPTRSSAVVVETIGSYGGYLQTDGYSAYNAATNAIRIGCWAHARRKFIDCLPKGIQDKDSKAAAALDIIERLFSIEKGFKDMPDYEIKKKRLEKSKPLLESYWKLLEETNPIGGSNLQKAVKYSLARKKELEGYLLDGRLEMTNNRAERAVKPFVIARKNFLFSDTSKGAKASAMCFTIIESAKLNNLDVFGYLTHLFKELPKLGGTPSNQELIPLLPWSKDLPKCCKTPE